MLAAHSSGSPAARADKANQKEAKSILRKVKSMRCLWEIPNPMKQRRIHSRVWVKSQGRGREEELGQRSRLSM